MAQLKAQLEAAGYDTTGFDEADLLSRLDQAGFDTSSLGGAPEAPKTGLDKAVEVSEAVTGTLGKVVEPFTSRLGKGLAAVKKASDDAADREAEASGRAGVLPISAIIPAVPSMLIDALGVPDRAGQFIAEKGGEYGMNPELAAGLGTAVSMAPDIAAGAAGIAKRAAIGRGLQSAGKSVAETAMAPGRFAKDLVTKPNVAEATNLGKEALVGISEKGGQKLALARETRDTAKTGLIKAEEKTGLHFESTPEFESMLKDPKRMSKFSQVIGRLAKRTPEELAQTVDTQTLQQMRKLAQEGEKVSGLSDIANAQMRQGKDVFTRALGKAEPEVGKALDTFREADKVVSELPKELRGRLEAQKMRNAKDVLSAKALDKKRKVIKGLLKSAAYYLGAKSIFQ